MPPGCAGSAADGPAVILVAIDEPVTARRATAYAFGQARRQGTRLVALYVVPAASLAMAALALTGSRAPARRAPDWSGQVLAAVTVAALTFAIIARPGSAGPASAARRRAVTVPADPRSTLALADSLTRALHAAALAGAATLVLAALAVLLIEHGPGLPGGRNRAGQPGQPDEAVQADRTDRGGRVARR